MTITQDQIQKFLMPTALIDLASVILSLVMSYIPKLREWFASQGDKYRPMFMFIIITAIVLTVGILSFAKVAPLVPTDTTGIFYLVFVWFSALKANQTTYNLSPQVKSVKDIKMSK